MVHTLRVTKECEGQRIDVFISSKTSLSRSEIKGLIRSGHVRVGGRAVKPSHRVKAEEEIELTVVEREAPSLRPEPIPIDIVYRDEDLLVVNKPPGLVMYPAAGHPSGTLMNAVAFHAGRLASVGAPLRPGVVHRLDKDTSGLVVVALTDRAYHGLVRQFKARSIKRNYIALVHGVLEEDSGEIGLPIGRSPTERKKMSVKAGRGRPALTLWRVRERFGAATMVEARLATGRTHQVRVHFSALGHPLLGDRTYGRRRTIRLDSRTLRIERQMLHAETLGFRHPVTGEWLEFHVPMPEDMAEVVRALRGAPLRLPTS